MNDVLSGAVRRKSLTLVLTDKCNLSCSYCYEQEERRQKQMPLDVAKQAVARFLRGLASDEEAEIAFHGGEPFLAFDRLREICEWIWSERWPVPLVCFATTNGTMVHERIKEWLAKNSERFWAGLSLDGTKEMHDANRSGSFDQIDIDFFASTWPTQPVKMTISPETLPSLAEGIAFIHRRGLRVNANLAYGLDWSAESLRKEWAEQLKRLVQFYIENPDYEPAGPLAMKIEVLADENAPVEKWCGVGTDMVAVDIDGREYSCHMFVPLTSRACGNSSPKVEWHCTEAIEDPRCATCSLRSLCATCYGDNYFARGSVALRDETRCNMVKLQAQACALLWARLLTERPCKATTPEEAATALRRIVAVRKIQAEWSGYSGRT